MLLSPLVPPLIWNCEVLPSHLMVIHPLEISVNANNEKLCLSVLCICWSKPTFKSSYISFIFCSPLSLFLSLSLSLSLTLSFFLYLSLSFLFLFLSHSISLLEKILKQRVTPSTTAGSNPVKMDKLDKNQNYEIF